MGDYLRSLGECVPKKSETIVSEEVEKTEEVKNVELKLEEELSEEMEREMSKLAEYYIALERGEPETVIWGTYEDYFRAASLVEEGAENEKDAPPTEPAPFVEIEINNGLGGKLKEIKCGRIWDSDSERSSEDHPCFRMDRAC